MNFSGGRQNDHIIVTLHSGRSVAAIAEELKQFIRSLIDQETAPKLIIDFAAVDFVDSSMLGALLSIYKHLNTIKGQMVLCGMKSEVRHTFEITQLYKVFKIADNTETAKLRFL